MRQTANALFVALMLGACGSSEPPPGQACSANNPCPTGFTCDPATSHCVATGTAPDARPPDGSPQPTPDAPATTMPDAATSPPDAPAGGGLTIAPPTHDFGGGGLQSTSAPFVLTVSNGGSATTGTLTATLSDASFSLAGDTCVGTTLAPAATCTVSVTFTPTGALGPRTGMLTVAGSPGGSAVATFTGMALSPASLAIDPAAHDFGPVALGAMSDEFLFTVSNGGGATSGALTPTLSDQTNFTVSSTTCTSMLDGAASCMVGVRFAPHAVGAIGAAMLTVAADPGGMAVATLMGTGTTTVTVTPAGTGKGTVTSDPAGIDCGTLCMASFSVASVTLTATPNATSTFDGWTGGGCSGTTPCTVALTAAQTVTPTFTLKPATLHLDPTSFVFPTTLTGNMSAGADFTVTNTGGATTGLIDLFNSDPSNYFVGGTCSGQVLVGGASCDVSVVFTPTGAPGPRGANFTVSAAPGGDQSADLLGNATCADQNMACSIDANCCANLFCSTGSHLCFSP
jgi:hypothetical protein